MKIQSTWYLRAFNFFEYLEKITKTENDLQVETSKAIIMKFLYLVAAMDLILNGLFLG